jgi:uridine phosphorylase
VEKIAGYLENPRPFHHNREFNTWLCHWRGQPVLVTSTGIGGPSAAIAVEELYATGVRTFIRVGTCGGMAPDVTGGDLVVANAAIRAEGLTREYVPLEFPAVSHPEVTQALTRAADALGLRRHVGVVQSKDSFYGQHSPERMPAGPALLRQWDAWLKAGCLASEMESAAVFIVAQTLGARAGCVLHTLWNQERQKRGLPNPTCPEMDAAIRAAVEAVKILMAADGKQDETANG